MRFTDDSDVLIRKGERAAQLAFRDTFTRRKAEAPRRTGGYAASLQLRVSGNTATIGSSHPGAWAIERGADVGARRGPHMGPVGTLAKAGDDFIDAMPRHLR